MVPDDVETEFVHSSCPPLYLVERPPVLWCRWWKRAGDRNTLGLEDRRGAWLPARCSCEPEQSLGPPCETAFARTGHGTDFCGYRCGEGPARRACPAVGGGLCRRARRQRPGGIGGPAGRARCVACGAGGDRRFRGHGGGGAVRSRSAAGGGQPAPDPRFRPGDRQARQDRHAGRRGDRPFRRGGRSGAPAGARRTGPRAGRAGRPPAPDRRDDDRREQPPHPPGQPARPQERRPAAQRRSSANCPISRPRSTTPSAKPRHGARPRTCSRACPASATPPPAP